MKESIVVIRVDYLNDGALIPISFIDNCGITHYIRSIEQTETFGKETIFHCILPEKKVQIIYDGSSWYLI